MLVERYIHLYLYVQLTPLLHNAPPPNSPPTPNALPIPPLAPLAPIVPKHLLSLPHQPQTKPRHQRSQAHSHLLGLSIPQRDRDQSARPAVPLQKLGDRLRDERRVLLVVEWVCGYDDLLGC